MLTILVVLVALLVAGWGWHLVLRSNRLHQAAVTVELEETGLNQAGDSQAVLGILLLITAGLVLTFLTALAR